MTLRSSFVKDHRTMGNHSRLSQHPRGSGDVARGNVGIW